MKLKLEVEVEFKNAFKRFCRRKSEKEGAGL